MSIRAIMASLIVVLSSSALVLGQPAKKAGQTVPEGWRFPILKDKHLGSQAGRAHSAAADLLHKNVDEVNWEENTFEEVLGWLNDQAEGSVNVIPKWTQLRNAGVNEDSLVTLKLRDVTVAIVLNEVLDQISQGDPPSYRAIGNVLRLSTKSDFAAKMEVRVYEIMDLAFRIPDMGRNAPTVDLQSASRSGGQGGGGGQSVFANASSSSSEDLEDEEQELEERLDDLIALIKAVVEPSSWDIGAGGTGGGGPGHIEYLNSRVLVVRNSIEVHEKLAGYFTYGK